MQVKARKSKIKNWMLRGYREGKLNDRQLKYIEDKELMPELIARLEQAGHLKSEPKEKFKSEKVEK